MGLIQTIITMFKPNELIKFFIFLWSQTRKEEYKWIGLINKKWSRLQTDVALFFSEILLLNLT